MERERNGSISDSTNSSDAMPAAKKGKTDMSKILLHIARLEYLKSLSELAKSDDEKAKVEAMASEYIKTVDFNKTLAD